MVRVNYRSPGFFIAATTAAADDEDDGCEYMRVQPNMYDHAGMYVSGVHAGICVCRGLHEWLHA